MVASNTGEYFLYVGSTNLRGVDKILGSFFRSVNKFWPENFGHLLRSSSDKCCTFERTMLHRTHHSQFFGTTRKVTFRVITTAVTAIGPSLGYLAKDVFVLFLRAAGANVLLFAKVDTKIIYLIYQWRLDKMLCYLHMSKPHLSCQTT